MNVTASKRIARLLTFAAAFAACAVLFSPTGALAATATVEGTVTVTGTSVTAEHPVNVALWELVPSDDPDFPEPYWETTEYYAQSTDGSWSIPDVDSSKQYKVVFDDDPFNWYQETVYPDVATDEFGEPTGGTLVTPGVGNPLMATMTQLPTSFTGTVKDAASKAPLSEVFVTAYELEGDEYVDVSYTMTAADGTYELHGLEAGADYEIEFIYDFYADVYKTVVAPTSATSLGDTLMKHVVSVERIAPAKVGKTSVNNFWSQPVNVAKRQFADDPTKPASQENPSNYEGVEDIVIVSGDTRGQSDPLSAAGLCWAYQVTDEESVMVGWNAPLLMVSSTKKTDPSVLAYILQIAENNGADDLHIRIVGGTNAVPDARFTEIKNYLSANGVTVPVVKDRVVSTGDRYALARGIALRMQARASESTTDFVELADFVLVANGADPTKFFDSLALSPITAANGAPILLVSKTAVPSATSSAIASLTPAAIYLAGGVNAVAADVYTALELKAPEIERLWGTNRYQTAINIANEAIENEWLIDSEGVAFASTIADGQLGGALSGTLAGPLLITPAASLNSSDEKWLGYHQHNLNRVYVVGSTTAITPTTFNAIKAAVAN